MQIMAIINVTPDSFYDGGRFYENNRVNIDKVLSYVDTVIDYKVDIIDIGAESTRPGFKPISVDEELSRIIPVIKAIKSHIDIPISVDTYKADVAQEVIKNDIDIINDIGFLSDDMLDVIKMSDVKYCLTHNRDISINKRSDNTITIDELNIELHKKINKLFKYSVDSNRILIDPGIGFGKSNADDIMILKNIDKLKVHNLPILIGASNKSCIEYVTCDKKDERLPATLSITASAFIKGASIIRVHDVKSNYKFLKMLEAIN